MIKLFLIIISFLTYLYGHLWALAPASQVGLASQDVGQALARHYVWSSAGMSEDHTIPKEYVLENEHQIRLWYESDGRCLHAVLHPRHWFFRDAQSPLEGVRECKVENEYLKIFFDKYRFLDSFVQGVLTAVANTEEEKSYKIYANHENETFFLMLPLKELTQKEGFVPGKIWDRLNVPDYYQYVAHKPGGGMGGAIYKDTKDNTIWLLKEAGNAYTGTYLYDAVLREVAVATMFKNMGIDIPEMKCVRATNGKLYVASRYEEGLFSEDRVKKVLGLDVLETQRKVLKEKIKKHSDNIDQLKKDLQKCEKDCEAKLARVDLKAYKKLLLYSRLMGGWDFFVGGNVRFRYDRFKNIYKPVLLDIGEALGANEDLGSFFHQGRKRYGGLKKHVMPLLFPVKEYYYYDIMEFLKNKAKWKNDNEFDSNLFLQVKRRNSSSYESLGEMEIFEDVSSFLDAMRDVVEGRVSISLNIETVPLAPSSSLDFLKDAAILPKNVKKDKTSRILLSFREGFLRLTCPDEEKAKELICRFNQQRLALYATSVSLAEMLFQDGADVCIPKFSMETRVGWKKDKLRNAHIFFQNQLERNIFIDVFGLSDIIEADKNLAKPRAYLRHELRTGHKLYVRCGLGGLKEWSYPQFEPIRTEKDLESYTKRVEEVTQNRLHQYAASLLKTFDTLILPKTLPEASYHSLDELRNAHLVLGDIEVPCLISAFSYDALTALFREMAKGDYQNFQVNGVDIVDSATEKAENLFKKCFVQDRRLKITVSSIKFENQNRSMSTMA